MKTIIRILIILAAAALVSGIFWALTSAASSGSGFQADGEFRSTGELDRRATEGFVEGNFRPDHEDGRRGELGFGVFGIIGTLRFLIPISLIVAVVLFVERGLNKRQSAQRS